MNIDTTAPATTSSTTKAAEPVARLAMITLDATRPEPLARFWQAVLGWPIVALEEEYAMLDGPAHALGIGQVPDHIAPTWPDSGRKQFHFDLAVGDLEVAARRCVELGAVRVEPQPGQTWIVLQDPAGHAFCLTDAKNWG